MEAADYVEAVLDVLGGGDTEFFLSVKSGRVLVQCRYQDCAWGESCGEIELWEFAADARAHWEQAHGS